MTIRLNFAAYSDIGKIREKNEDMVFISSELRFAAVADGMGGTAPGK
ncbi:serine/threonine protein phosphatase PrpC [Elusimicrobium simillimum]